MKNTLFLLLLFCGKGLLAQSPDSVRAALQLDSLLQESQSLTGKLKFENALQLTVQAEKLALQHFGAISIPMAQCKQAHGRVLHQWSKLEDAEFFYQEAIRIREAAQGKENAEYASSLTTLAILYRALGEYEQAESLYLEARDIRARVLGKNHSEYAGSLNNLGNIYRIMGEYDKAEPLYLEALEIRMKTIGKEHSDYATVLNNLARLYREKGDYVKSAPLNREALDIWERVKGKENIDYAWGLAGLANLNLVAGHLDEAELLQLEAKGIRERVLGKDHPDYAGSLEFLGNLYLLKGNHAAAEKFIQECIDVRGRILGKDHPLYAKILDTKGNLYRKTGAWDQAEVAYREALGIWSKVFGNNHGEYATTLGNLAMLCHKKGDYKQAGQFYQEQLSCQWYLIGKSAEYSSENELNAYIRLFQSSMDHYYAYALRQQQDTLCSAAYDNALFLNGLLLENSRLLSRALLEADTNTQKIYEQWQGCHRRLAKRYARPIAERKKIAEVEAEAEAYEKQLLRSLPVFRQTRKPPKWQQLHARLKRGEAAIEFIHFRWYTPNPTDSICYAALLIRPEYPAPKMIPLFEEKQLRAWLNSPDDAPSDYYNELYTLPGQGFHVAQPVRPTLYELIWKPLEKDLAGVTNLYLAPAGLLHRVNLGAIPFHPDSLVMDRYFLKPLGCTRQLLSANESSYSRQDAILFGGIRFDMDTTAIFSALEQQSTGDLADRGLDINEEATEPGALEWPYIKYTEKEVKALEPLFHAAGFTTEVRTGYEATEEAIKWLGTQGRSPRIIHLATHGFFFPDPNAETSSVINEKETGFKTSTNPLIRSGLLFAGANYAWKTGKPIKKGMENGILTAYEISHLNLPGTELVTLSACETGLGDIKGSEGVYGLQRGFRIAGVKYQIMSLWPVPDAQTKELMTIFYTRWLQDKQDISDAFRSAQQEMREGYQDPYFWAAFLLIE